MVRHLLQRFLLTLPATLELGLLALFVCAANVIPRGKLAAYSPA